MATDDHDGVTVMLPASIPLRLPSMTVRHQLEDGRVVASYLRLNRPQVGTIRSESRLDGQLVIDRDEAEEPLFGIELLAPICRLCIVRDRGLDTEPVCSVALEIAECLAAACAERPLCICCGSIVEPPVTF